VRAGAAAATLIYRACSAGGSYRACTNHMRAAGSRKSVQTSLTMAIFKLTNHNALNRFIITMYGNNFRKYDYKSPSLALLATLVSLSSWTTNRHHIGVEIAICVVLVSCVVFVIRDVIVSIVYVVYRIILLTMPMSTCAWLV